MGLSIAAAFATTIALCGLILLLIKAENWRPAALAFVIALPLQPLAFYVIRLPLDGSLKVMFGFAPWVAFVSIFYAPLTEEPAKWAVALWPAVRRAIQLQPVTMALSAGLGFAVGEIWFVAHAFASQPNYIDMPAWMFAGFIVERLEVCFLHGAFLALPFAQYARGGPFWPGGLAGMALHLFLNLPIFLARRDVFGFGNAWLPVLALWTLGYVGGCAVMIAAIARRSAAPARQG